MSKACCTLLFCRFYELLQAGHDTSSASRTLHVERTTLLRAVHRLETDIGKRINSKCVLVDLARGRPATLTTAGNLLYAGAHKSLGAYAALYGESTRNEQLTIGATNFVTTYLLPRAFAQQNLLKQFPASTSESRKESGGICFPQFELDAKNSQSARPCLPVASMN